MGTTNIHSVEAQGVRPDVRVGLRHPPSPASASALLLQRSPGPSFLLLRNSNSIATQEP